jgi:hypothetical protein
MVILPWCPALKKSVHGGKSEGAVADLVPCKGSGCPDWKTGEGRGGCHHLIQAQKHGRDNFLFFYNSRYDEFIFIHMAFIF